MRRCWENIGYVRLKLKSLFCSSKFNVNVCDIVSGEANVSRAVNKNVITTIEEHQIQSASFLRELVLLRDNYLVFFE
jgi:hypothetical protein